MTNATRHLLPGYLERNLIFGLEVKLAWRRFRNYPNKIIPLFFKRNASASERILRTAVAAAAIFGVVCIIAMVSFEKNTNYCMNSFDNAVSLLFRIASALFFISYAALTGSNLYDNGGSKYFYRQMLLAGYSGRKIAKEVLASSVLRILPFVILTSFSYGRIVRLLPVPFDIDPVGAYDQYVIMTIALVIMQVLIYTVSSVFGLLIKDAMTRWICLFAFWILPGYLFTKSILFSFGLAYGDYFIFIPVAVFAVILCFIAAGIAVGVFDKVINRN